MTTSLSPVDELRALADIACDGALTKSDAARLERLLSGNASAQQYYLAHVCLARRLRWEFAHRVQESTPLCPPPPAPTALSITFPGTTGYLSSGWPVAYLITTVVFGIGALIGAFTYVSQPGHVALRSATPPAPAIPPAANSVGRVTGMVDCRWTDPDAAAIQHANVPLGRRFSLSSGLMEITYNTGAKVLLQGPVTYAVESRNGGFMSVGKLTGKIGAREARGFVVRTPTATITDLGTEFGVETDGQRTWSCVFQGQVEVAGIVTGGRRPSSFRLKENESTMVDAAGIASTGDGMAGRRFVRALPRGPSEDHGGQTVFLETFARDSRIVDSAYPALTFGMRTRFNAEAQSDYAAVSDGRLRLSRILDEQSYEFAETKRRFSGPILVAVDIGRDSTPSLLYWHVALRLGRLEVAFHPGLRMESGLRGVFRVSAGDKPLVPNSDMGFVPGVDVLHHLAVYYDGKDQYDVRLQDGVNSRNVYCAHFASPENLGKPFPIGVRRFGYAGTGMFDNLRVIQRPAGESAPDVLGAFMKGTAAMH
jgi:hypothetical protein